MGIAGASWSLSWPIFSSLEIIIYEATGLRRARNLNAPRIIAIENERQSCESTCTRTFVRLCGCGWDRRRGNRFVMSAKMEQLARFARGGESRLASSGDARNWSGVWEINSVCNGDVGADRGQIRWKRYNGRKELIARSRIPTIIPLIRTHLIWYRGE